MPWRTIRKTLFFIHVDIGMTTDLFAEHLRVRNDDGPEIAIDLSKNLRTRNKQENTYADAKALAADFGQLRSVQLSDSDLAKEILRLTRSGTQSAEWNLLVELGDDSHLYRVRPERQGEYLFLHVVN